MSSIVSILISALGFFAGAQLLKGVELKSYPKAIIIAIVIALLNITLGVFLKIISLGILSLGIFTLLLDALLIQIADYFVDGFSVKNFWWALFLAAIVSFIERMVHGIL